MWKTFLKNKLEKNKLDYYVSSKFKEEIIEKGNLKNLFKLPHTRYLYLPINHDLLYILNSNFNKSADVVVTSEDFETLILKRSSTSRELTSEEIKELGLPKIDNIDSYFDFRIDDEQIEFILPNEFDKEGKFLLNGEEISIDTIKKGDYGYIYNLLTTRRCSFNPELA